jgi:outer membrane protein assembly factor BamB
VDGSVKWRFRVRGEVWSSPAVASDGTVYFGTMSGVSGEGPGNCLYAVTADGERKWRYPTGSWVQSSPAIGSDGTIYVCNSAAKLFAFTPGGTCKWTVKGKGAIWLSSPVISQDGTVYYGTNAGPGGSGILYAISRSGRRLWAFEAGSGMNHPAAVGPDGTIYVCTEEGHLRAVDPGGRQLWEFASGSNIEGSPAIAPDGTIRFACDGGDVFAVGPGGSQMWSTHIGGIVQNAPAIDRDGNVYVLGDALVALGPDGEVRWTSARDDGYSETGPAIGPGGVIYVAGEKALLAVGQQ